MHKIPTGVDINRLKGQTVSQISFGLNYILLSFDNSSIQFSGPFHFIFDGKEYKRDEVYPVDSDFGLINLLEKKIVNVFCNIERTSLTIEYDCDSSLHLLSNEMYESFEINIEGTRAIV